MSVNTKGTLTEKLQFVTSVIKPVLTGDNRGLASFLGTFFVNYLRLNSMIIQPKYNSPSREVSSSNASPFHRDGSLPIGGFLLGD